MKNLIYIDCEFSCSLFPELLSLGLVTADGIEHYVELDPSEPDAADLMVRSSGMVLDDVLNQFGMVPDAACSRQEMGARTATWLAAQAGRLREQVRIAFDYRTDFELLQELLRDTGHWQALHTLVAPYNVKELTGHFEASMVADQIQEEFRRRRGLGRHHALADAHALRAACVATLTGKRVRL